jgi:hypothetical protein
MTPYLLALAFFLSGVNTDIKDVVKEFHQLKTEEAEIKFITKYNQSTDPSVLAYVVSIAMKQAEYSYNPYYKLNVFNTNKALLDSLIMQHSSNTHLRYVRLVVQQNTPWILGYNGFIEEDQLFLKKMLEVKDESDYLDQYIMANTAL